MRVARFYDKGDIRVEDIDEPCPGNGKVLVDVEWCELHDYIMGANMLLQQHVPVALGHELCGRVKDPPNGSRFKDGDAVMIDPRILCGSCLACKAGDTKFCRNFGYVGVSTNGGYGERVLVAEQRLRPLGKIPLEYAALIEPLAIVHHAVKEAGVKNWKDQTVLVLGGGPIGFALLLDLRAHGATKVVISEPTRLRREQVSEFAQAVIDPTKENVAARCQEIAGAEGVDVVFDCAGVPAALDAAFDAIKTDGLYVNIAVWEKPMVLPRVLFMAKHITIKGVLFFTTEEFEQVMQWMEEGKFSGYEKMVTSRIGVEDIVEKGFKELIENKDNHIKILVTPRKDLLVQ